MCIRDRGNTAPGAGKQEERPEENREDAQWKNPIFDHQAEELVIDEQAYDSQEEPGEDPDPEKDLVTGGEILSQEDLPEEEEPILDKGEAEHLGEVVLAAARPQHKRRRYGIPVGVAVLSLSLIHIFPSYSVGETRPSRGPGRREIGHGALAERALVPVIPPVEEFPYALRLVSEVVSSNGSTSQASICGSTLALMDAGVPIKKPVAGISCGLITEGERWMTMVDIQGLEDFLSLIHI